VLRAALVLNRVVVAPHHARHAMHPGTGVDPPDHLWEGLIRIAAVDVVHLRIVEEDFTGDVVFEGRAAEDDRDVGMSPLEGFGQREGCEHLLEYHAETDCPVTGPIDFGHDVFDELLGPRLMQSDDVADVGARPPGDRREIGPELVEISVDIEGLAERGLRPDPLAGHATGHLGERFVQTPARELAEAKKQRHRFDFETRPLDQRFE